MFLAKCIAFCEASQSFALQCAIYPAAENAERLSRFDIKAIIVEIVESFHWKKQKKIRRNIEDYMIEYAIMNSEPRRDPLHENALNSIARIPETGKTLKVVFRRIGKDRIKLITSYYLD